MINLCMNNRWLLTLFWPLERRVEYLYWCLERSMVSSSCWICVIISWPFNATWQIGHCGFCKSNVDDRHRFSRKITIRCSYNRTSCSTHSFVNKDRRAVCRFHPVFNSVSLVKSLIILWLLFHLWITIRPYV
jgi:hypothetical protein